MRINKYFFLFIVLIIVYPAKTGAQENKNIWQIGFNIGTPFLWGDFSSFTYGKTYVGLSGGVQLSYQLTSVSALTLVLDYGTTRMGSKEYAKGYYLSKSGMTYYIQQDQTAELYKNLYSKNSFFDVGFLFDINLNHLFTKRNDNRLHFFLSPAIYTQHFSSSVHKKETDLKFTDGNMNGGWGLGLGGDFTMRYRFSNKLDLQLKSGLVWIANNNFDGIATVVENKLNAAWNNKIGIIWNIK